jgi:thiol-disulfide isomerase/thioredoxin
MDGTARLRSPEFPADLTWINTSRPLHIADDLRGHIVLLDFWTYCCINCLHTIPVLRRIAERFAGEPVAVIGVHSAKFISERDPENIRRAVRRHGIVHPVVVDSKHDIRERFTVHAWPTLVVVDAAGYVRYTLPGEVREDELAAAVERLLTEGRDRDLLAPTPLDITPDPDTEATVLRFPGKLLVSGDTLYVADSGHNQIVIAGLDGRVRARIGAGDAGAHDGPAQHASFRAPQGLAIAPGTMYIADAGNHLVRAVDLATLRVTTVAGSGRKGESRVSFERRDPRQTHLRSPWAMAAAGGTLFLAMAGSHQIWVFDPTRGQLAPWAGSGREDHIDGSLAEAAFAQPSGLALVGRQLLVADSEVSSIRAIDLQEGVVRTLVGRGLFDFGDRDGAPEEVLLQHPLDVAADADVVYVADTYNNKIKAIAFDSMGTRTVLGDGDPVTMHEPGGIAVDRGAILIADTNNHRVLRGDPLTGEIEELEIED